MTTLHKQIEAAREALKRTLIMENMGSNPKDYPEAGQYAREALSTLPTKPMTEDEIWEIIFTAWKTAKKGKACDQIIRALRDAGALYVSDK